MKKYFVKVLCMLTLVFTVFPSRVVHAANAVLNMPVPGTLEQVIGGVKVSSLPSNTEGNEAIVVKDDFLFKKNQDLKLNFTPVSDKSETRFFWAFKHID